MKETEFDSSQRIERILIETRARSIQFENIKQSRRDLSGSPNGELRHELQENKLYFGCRK